VNQVSIIGGRERPTAGFELYAWLFMRVSGVLLLFLALGHLAVIHLYHGVDQVNFALVAARYRNPLWRLYDWALLTLALVHGLNGLRMLVNDYVRRPGLRVFSVVVVYFLAFVFLLLGSYIILVFQPPATG